MIQKQQNNPLKQIMDNEDEDFVNIYAFIDYQV